VPWRDVELVSEDRVPSLRVRGHDDVRFHVSLTHTDEMAVAVVVAEDR
jgi:phosphopantetheinyl transferase (holo-ACP synthase)